MIHYLTPAEVLFIHSSIIDETKGTHGVRDLGLMQSAVLRAQQTFGGKDLHPTLDAKAAALFLGLLKNHPFVDGNKRTAVTALGVFLELNGLRLNVEPDRVAAWVESTAAGHPKFSSVAAWIRSHSQRVRRR